MKTKYPARPEQFKMRVERMESYVKNGHFRIIPAISALECELLLQSYYGGPRRMIFALTRKSVWLWWNGSLAWLIYQMSDLVGWTKIVNVPETKEFISHQRRHGSKCHASPNCEGGCIERDQPKWFRKLTNKILNLE